ncbi:hypothetical protein CT19431_U10004 [Cupriavidus taiwanensis]|nr:hypothetical protein CT19431_U10004 [Cupriavidus taiwanensis]
MIDNHLSANIVEGIMIYPNSVHPFQRYCVATKNDAVINVTYRKISYFDVAGVHQTQSLSL